MNKANGRGNGKEWKGIFRWGHGERALGQGEGER